jgi:drug/metabolite transporter (DMT)-like permease
VSSLATPRAASSLAGIALGATAYSLFAVHDALVKGVIDTLPVIQILFVRSFVIVVLCLVLGRAKLVGSLVHSKNKPMILGRAVLTLAAWCMYYSTGRDLQLAEMTTLYYFAPVLTTILAVIFLHERLTLARVGAASIGFFGVVVACNPAGVTLGLPAILVLLAALCWAVAMILMRTISKTESALVQVLALNLFYVLALGAFALISWHSMALDELVAVLAVGIIGGIAQYVLVEAARAVPASVLGTVEYSALLWAFLFGYLFWREEPASTVYSGAALIMAAGFILAWSEHRARRTILETP